MEDVKKVVVIFQKILKITIPTGIAMFPKEMSGWPPKTYIERIFNVKQMSKMTMGGHFPALEKPRLLIEDIRKFYKDF